MTIFNDNFQECGLVIKFKDIVQIYGLMSPIRIKGMV
jgi:hypothetical protein